MSESPVPKSSTPAPEQVRTHLANHPPRGPSRRSAWLVILALGAGLVLSGAAQNPVTLVVPWLILGGVWGVLGWRARAGRRLEARVGRAQELTALRRWAESLRLAWRLLPQLAATPELHGRTVALIAHNLDRLKAHEAAIVAYDFLIDHLPPEHPAAVQLRIQRAMTQLACDHLADADEALRRLRGTIEGFRGTPIGASYRLASLMQQTRTGHYADAVAEAGDLVLDLQPLGVEAGYGHALMALACHSAGEPRAGQWWSRATLLLPVRALTERFAELAPLQAQLTADAADSRPPGTGGQA